MNGKASHLALQKKSLESPSIIFTKRTMTEVGQTLNVAKV